MKMKAFFDGKLLTPKQLLYPKYTSKTELDYYVLTHGVSNISDISVG